MKKNRMMRLASGLLVAVLATTSMISGTYAKYVTQDTASDVARVAKWGVTVLASGSLYGEKYATAADNFITASDDKNVVSVWGKQATGTTTNNVVAPGTKSDQGFKFAINGKPEVDSKVTVSITHQNIFLGEGDYGVMVPTQGITVENFEPNVYYTKSGTTYTLTDEHATELYELHDTATVAATGYWPVVYALNADGTGTSYISGNTEGDSLKAVADLIIDKIDDTATSTPDTDYASKYVYSEITKNIENNIDLADDALGLNLGNETISWNWDFSTSAENDAADTILGNLMAERIGTADWKGDVVMLSGTSYVQPVEGTNFCLDTNFEITMKVEQVD